MQLMSLSEDSSVGFKFHSEWEKSQLPVIPGVEIVMCGHSDEKVLDISGRTQLPSVRKVHLPMLRRKYMFCESFLQEIYPVSFYS